MTSARFALRVKVLIPFPPPAAFLPMDCLRRSLRELPHSQPSPVVRAIQSLERRVPWGALLERTGQGRGEMTQSEPTAGEARTAGPGTGLFALAGGRTYSWCLLQVPMVAVAQDRERETSMVVAASRDFTGDWQIPESGADSPGTSEGVRIGARRRGGSGGCRRVRLRLTLSLGLQAHEGHVEGLAGDGLEVATD